ncbi:MAG: hypothetical protein NTY50_04385 [Methylobacter sp.]|nr:hypothetical protein [Methylobacter sp.]
MSKQNIPSNEQQSAFAYCYLTVNQFCEKHKAFKIGGVRARIFNADKNGLKESGAILRDGKKVLINETKWFAHLEAENQGGK